jgi:hypothetical protein
MSDMKRTATQALAVLDQATEVAWARAFSDPSASIKVALFMIDRNVNEVRLMTDEQLSYLVQLAYIGHTHMCRQKMTRESNQ